MFKQNNGSNKEEAENYIRASMIKLDFSRKPTQWLILILLALTWGSSFILMKKGLEHFSAQEVAAYRISLASLVLLPIGLRNIFQIKLNFWPLLITGLCGNAVPAFLFAIAQTQISSGLSGILNSLTSLFTLLFGIAIFRFKTTSFQVAGVLLALIGSAGLIGFQSLASFSENSRYALLVVLASAMYGVAVNTIKSKLPDMRPTQITALSFLLTGPLCLMFLLVATPFTNTISQNNASWLGLFYLTVLAVVGTAAAVILFNRLIKETSAVFASTVTYLIPAVAVGWGLVDGEEMLIGDIGFMAIILGGIFLINSKSPNTLISKLFR